MHLKTKTKLYDFCLNYIKDKQFHLQSSIDDSQNSLEMESKSTAGDKHDTGRAMLHLEVEKKSKQLVELEKLKRVMLQITPEKPESTVELGSLVYTNKGNYYLAISAGKTIISTTDYFVISLASPLGQALKKNQDNKDFKFRDQHFTILSIH